MTRSSRLVVAMVITAIFLLVAVAVEIYLINQFLKTREAVNWPQTNGKILRSELKSKGALQTNYEARIEYEYRVGNKAYQSGQVRARGNNGKQHEVGPLVEMLPVGKEVPVFYNPANPADALLVVGVDGMDQLITIAPVPFILGTVYFLFLMFRERRKSPEQFEQEADVEDEFGSYTLGPRVRFHCPNCKKEVTARTYRDQQQFATSQPFSTIECLPCGVSRTTKLPLEELDQYSADELNAHFCVRESFVAKFLAIAGVVMFFFPFVGLALAGFGLLMNWKTGGWPKRVSFIGVALSGVVSLIYVVMWLIYG
jgi:hypothetical protein